VPDTGRLLADLRTLINEARAGVARAVNAALVLLHWEIGRRVRTDILADDRAGYGDQIVATLSPQLTTEFGRGYTPSALWRMIRFAEAFPERDAVSTCPGFWGGVTSSN
jgi:hypothetical protein